MNLPDSKYDQELTDLLVAYDAALASGNRRSVQVEERLRFSPPEVRLRFDRARNCLLRIERTWPRSLPRPFPGKNRLTNLADWML